LGTGSQPRLPDVFVAKIVKNVAMYQMTCIFVKLVQIFDQRVRFQTTAQVVKI
jgi:hypothetical protein